MAPSDKEPPYSHDKINELQVPTRMPHQARMKHGAQTTSLFLSKLPVEIRLMIYEELLRSWGWTRGIHILKSTEHRTRLIYVPCHKDSAAQVSLKAQGFEIHWTKTHYFCRNGPLWVPVRPLSLFLSCRQIHTEAIDLLYSSFTFNMIDLEAALLFFETVPRDQINRIQAIKVSFVTALNTSHDDFKHHPQALSYDWHKLCILLSRMAALEKLTFSMPLCSLRKGDQLRIMKLWLENIRQVRKKNFIVVVPMERHVAFDLEDADRLMFIIERIQKQDFPMWDFPMPIEGVTHAGRVRRLGRWQRPKLLWNHALSFPIDLFFFYSALVVSGFRSLKRSATS